MKGSIAATRRSFAVLVCMMLALVSVQVQAQTCTGTPSDLEIDPIGQTVPESIPGTPSTVQLKAVTAKVGATFSWAQTAGPTVTLIPSAAVANPTFTAPSVGATMLRFQVTARCSTGQPRTASTDINVTDVVTNAPPTAVASASPATAHEGDLVTLDGSASYDIDPGTTLTYSWVQTGIGPDSPAVTLDNANAAGSIVTFVAPNTPVTTGAVLTFRLTVSDGTLTGTADQSVNIVWTNDPPVASLVCPAGGVIVVDEGDLVELDGSGSFDSDGSIVGYSWSQATGLPNLGIGALDTPTISFNAPSLGYQQLGNLTLTLTVTDDIGATDEATCSLWINDVTAPMINVPADTTIEADFAGGKSFSYSVTAMDAVDDQEPYPLACAPASGSVFPLAAAPANQTVTTVACSTVDSAGNSASASFKVTVEDSTAPHIHVPGSHAVEAAGPSGAVANYGPIATSDAVDGPGAASCVLASGSLFPLGTTTVECTAVDARGNGSQAGFPVVVHDLTPPVFGPAPDVLAEAQSASGAVVDYDVPAAVDLVDGPVAVACLPAPGGTFGLGSTTVTCSAADGSGNTAQVQFDVVVEDTTPPTLTLPADITEEATSASGAVVVFAVSASDLVDGDVLVACTPASGATFPLGPTAVSCSAADAAGNPATGGFTVHVVDTTPPVIAPHPDVGPIEATGPGGAQVFYDAPSTSDAVDGTGVASCLPASGGIFPLGQTAVTCTAVDAANNPALPTGFLVTVHDTTKPVVTPPANVGPIEATGPTTSVDPGTATAFDAVGVVEESNDAPAAFPVGTTTITWIARDAAGNTGSATSKVTVVDTTPPTIAPMADILGVEATGPSGAVVAYASPATHDLVDGAGTAACDPASGSTFPLGLTAVTCTASDSRGNPAVPVVFQVGVVDTTAPVVTPPANVQAEATGPLTVVVFGSATATDAVGVVDLAHDAPASFPLGATVITWTARDAAGNIGTATSTVTVVDSTPPAFDPYADVHATATGNSQAIVHFALPTASDLVDGPVPVTCSHASGASYPAGSTTVTCSAQDGRTPANVATMSFQVHVTYAWTGFFRPIDNLPTVNTVKAGSAVPVKFSLGGNQGLDVFEAGYPRSGPINCTASNQDEITETVTAGQSSLSYDAGSGQYVYVWKTERNWSGCRVLQVKLRDGRSHYAMFQFR